jgi:hypothetical protein
MMGINSIKEKLSKTIKKNLIKNQKKVFRKIYKNNLWRGNESVSGPGSDISQVENVISGLTSIIETYKINTLLDIPCGDFHWMKHVNLDNINYIGGDIVEEIVIENISKYKKRNIEFINIDLIKDDLPEADLLLVRDCLVHFPYNKVFSALKNIKKSKAVYLLTTFFSNTAENHDIVLGDWRPLNLLKPPFSFPEPLLVINENCTENNNKYSDKSLGLWLIDDLPIM